jgi:fructose-bisphosphate aldolase class II
MPVVNYDKYCEMLDNAKKNKFAYPAINVTSEVTAKRMSGSIRRS